MGVLTGCVFSRMCLFYFSSFFFFFMMCRCYRPPWFFWIFFYQDVSLLCPPPPPPRIFPDFCVCFVRMYRCYTGCVAVMHTLIILPVFSGCAAVLHTLIILCVFSGCAAVLHSPDCPGPALWPGESTFLSLSALVCLSVHLRLSLCLSFFLSVSGKSMSLGLFKNYQLYLRQQWGRPCVRLIWRTKRWACHL